MGVDVQRLLIFLQQVTTQYVTISVTGQPVMIFSSLPQHDKQSMRSRIKPQHTQHSCYREGQASTLCVQHPHMC